VFTEGELGRPIHTLANRAQEIVWWRGILRSEAPWHTPDGPFGAPSDRQRPPLLLHLQCGESRSEGMYAMCTLS